MIVLSIHTYSVWILCLVWEKNHRARVPFIEYKIGIVHFKTNKPKSLTCSYIFFYTRKRVPFEILREIRKH